MPSTRRRLRSLLIALPAGLLACGPSGSEQQPATNGLESMDAALKAALPEVFGTEHLHVPKGELACAEADFADHIHYGDSASHAPIPMPSGGIQMKVSELLTVLGSVEPCEPNGPIERGVVVHYGLNNASEFDVRLQVLCITYDEATEEYEYAGSDDCYRIKADGSLESEPGGLAAWKATGGWHRYASRVMIRSNSDPVWNRIDAAVEPNSAIHGEDAVRDLITQNGLSEGEVALVPIATPSFREMEPDSSYEERGFHQGLAWVPVGVDLDDSIYVNEPFRAKALDVGSPCPHLCPNTPFKFWVTATPPRHTCK
ncbi:MAG: hypothetical protein IPK70_14645 [Flavobacteriales bacterium]|jgi:hypothetical protein|nr:hypothetical protein [Flavobacteriales bacterium]